MRRALSVNTRYERLLCYATLFVPSTSASRWSDRAESLTTRSLDRPEYTYTHCSGSETPREPRQLQIGDNPGSRENEDREDLESYLTQSLPCELCGENGDGCSGSRVNRVAKSARETR